MNLYSEEILKKEFSDENSKQAYLNACKWLAKNIYSKDEFAKYLTVNIKKNTRCKLPTFVVRIFLSYDFDEMNERFCKKCTILNNTFYQMEKPNCDYCKHKAFIKRIEKELKELKKFYEESI